MIVPIMAAISPENRTRFNQMKAAAEGFLNAVRTRDFDAIPYADQVVLRAPLVRGGSHAPLSEKRSIRERWWPRFSNAITSVEILDYFVNDTFTEMCTRAILHVHGSPRPLRVAFVFAIDNNGRITAQENHYDPRELTHPGWHEQEHQIGKHA